METMPWERLCNRFCAAMYFNGTHESQLAFLAPLISNGPSSLSHGFQ